MKYLYYLPLLLPEFCLRQLNISTSKGVPFLAFILGIKMQRKVSVSVHSVSGAQRWLLAGSVGCQNRNICGKTEK